MARIKNTDVYVFDAVPEVSSFLIGSDQGDGRISKSYRIDTLFGLAETEGFVKEAPLDGQPYLRQNGGWELVPPSGVGSVFSVFGRTGAVTAQLTDYSSFFSQLGHTHTEAEITDLKSYLLPTDIGLTVQAWSAALDAVSGTNTGDQTSIVGITGTKAQFDSTLTDGNFMYIGDAPTAHTHVEADITDLKAYLLDAPSDGSTYGRLNGTWSAIPSSVTSVFGRTGAVAAVAGDYSSFYASLSHTHVKADITDFSVDIADLNTTGTASASTWLRGDGTWGTILGGVSSVFGRTADVVATAGDYDAFYYTKAEIANFFNGTTPITGYNNTNWDTAFGWGDHSAVDYIRESQPADKTGGDLVFHDSIKAKFGTSGDMSIFHTGTDNIVQLDLGDLIIRDGVTERFTFGRTTGDLAVTGALTVSDEVYGVGWNGSFEVPTKNALYDKIETLGGTAAWGSITGTLSAQTDLQAALDAKVDLAGDTMTGNLTVEANVNVTTGFLTAKNTGHTWRTLAGNSSSARNYLFGGSSVDDTATLDTYIRVRSIADGDLMFQENSLAHKIWHEGNRPTIDNMAYKSDLGAAQNLDTYTTTGLYHQNANADAATGSNYPHAVAGMLTVKEGDAFIYQYYHTYQPNNDVWVRSKYFSTWSSWEKIWTSGNDGSGSGLDADFFKGLTTSASGARWNCMATVSGSGVLENGRYIDFHNTNTDTSDYTARFDNHTNGQVRMTSTATTDIFEVSNSATEFSQLAANVSGGYLILSDDSLTNTILRGYGDSDFYGGSLSVRNSHGIGIEHLTSNSFQLFGVGGGYYHQTGSVNTGSIQIALPSAPTGTSGNASDMMQFSVAIFDYAGGDGDGESVIIDICGYPHGTGWANTNAVIHTTRIDKDYDITFRQDATSHYVCIGTVGQSWGYPQVKIFNVFGGYGADIDNWHDGWSISFETVQSGTLDHTITANLPTAGRVNLKDNDYIYFGTGTGESSLRSNGSDTYWDFRADRDLFLRDVTTTRFQFDISTGDLIATDFSATSDERLKKNIKPLSSEYNVTTNWIEYDWIEHDTHDIGLSAQDLEKTNPEFVRTDKEGFKSVNYTKLLVAKMAEKDRQIEQQENRIKMLEDKIYLILKTLI